MMNGCKSNASAVALQFVRWMIGWHFLYEGVWKLFQSKGWSCLSYLEGAQGPLAPVFRWMAEQSVLVLIGDYAVMWGLVLIGISLITGVFARLAALFGILLMMMFYCAQPPEPFARAFSGADGRFFVFERNVIESLGLLLIAVFPRRRGFLRTLLPGLAVLAVFSGLVWRHHRAGGFETVEAVTSATVKVHEFTVLSALVSPIEERVDFAGVKISPLSLGGDLMAGRSHARDLIWTDEFMRRYHCGGSLERMIRYSSFCGINAAFVDAEFCARIRETAASVGVEFKCFANCAAAEDAALAKKSGAVGVYLRPERTDALVKAGDESALKALFAALRATGLAVGIGAGDVAGVRYCVERGIKPDYWVVSFHSLDYPAATLKTRCNNIWCEDPEATAAYMKTLPEPWVAIRVLAGGAIAPVTAYEFARSRGARAVAVDLLDYRVVETVNALMKEKEVGK